MTSLIMRLGQILNQMKGFDTAYGTNNHGKMVIDYEGDRYLVKVEKISEANEQLVDDYKKYVQNK